MVDSGRRFAVSSDMFVSLDWAVDCAAINLFLEQLCFVIICCACTEFLGYDFSHFSLIL